MLASDAVAVAKLSIFTEELIIESGVGYRHKIKFTSILLPLNRAWRL